MLRGPALRATYIRTQGVRHLFAAYDLRQGTMYRHVNGRKTPVEFLMFARYLRSLYPSYMRIALVMHNLSPHLSAACDARVGEWVAANNVEIAYNPTNSFWLNRIEAQFTALRYFGLDGTVHADHKARGSVIRRHII